jgi:hypothetical protein
MYSFHVVSCFIKKAFFLLLNFSKQFLFSFFLKKRKKKNKHKKMEEESAQYLYLKYKDKYIVDNRVLHFELTTKKEDATLYTLHMNKLYYQKGDLAFNAFNAIHEDDCIRLYCTSNILFGYGDKRDLIGKINFFTACNENDAQKHAMHSKCEDTVSFIRVEFVSLKPLLK